MMGNKETNHFENAQWIFVKDIPEDVCNTYFEYSSIKAFIHNII